MHLVTTQVNDERTSDIASNPTAASRRQCITRSRKGSILKQIVSELEDEARIINNGITFPTIPSFRLARDMVRPID